MHAGTLRLVLFGLVAGALLSAMRAPTGLDWTQVPAVSGTTASLFRAGALIAVALFLDAGRPAFRPRLSVAGLLLAMGLGYALHGFFLADRWQPGSRLGFTLLLLGGTIALALAAGRSRRGSPATPEAGEELEGGPALETLGFVERLGLAIAAAGATLAWENLGHQVRLLGLGLPEDHTLLGTVFFTTLAVGALCFGAVIARPRWERVVLGSGLVVAAGSTVFGLVFVGNMQMDPIWGYLRRFDLDPSFVGTWRASGLLAGASLVIAGFATGTALSAARHAGRLSCVALGAAAGLVLRPQVILALAQPLEFPERSHTPWAWLLLLFGCVVAAIGAVVFLLASESGTKRVVGIAISLAALGLPFTWPRLPVWIFSPWHQAPLQPELVVPTPEGIVTVEKSAHGEPIVTVDRRRVSPIHEEERIDERRLVYAWFLLDPELRTSGRARCLFIGQMTPGRADALQGLGFAKLDRTAPWFTASAPVETALFGAGREPPGERIAPAEARRRIGAGEYDLVVAAPTHGPVLRWKSESQRPWGAVAAPATKALSVPEGTVGVAWLDADSPLAGRDLTERVLLAMDGFQHLSVGLVVGDVASSPERPALFPTGPPGRRIPSVELLSENPRERGFGMQTRFLRRLERASRDHPLADLARGLALHFAAQTRSSPYESVAQTIELEEDALRAFLGTAKSEHVDPFLREIWEGLAWLLTEKRRPDLVLSYLEPVAEKFGPWPILDRAVARAYVELLEPAEALRVLERLHPYEASDPSLALWMAELARELGEDSRVLLPLRETLALAGAPREVERALGLALVRTGDEEGREILERLLAEDPEDEEIRRSLEQGPAPAPAPAPGDG